MTDENTYSALPKAMEIRGARVHNLKNIDVDIPLHKLVGIAGVSGSGKSSLALGILYAEGSRRYLEALSTYTRRRMSFASAADVDSVEYVPAALALHQRPAVPGICSTFGTMTELLNSLRLMFSRLASHVCPHGHYCEPTLNVAADKPLVCPVCGESFYAPSAEDLAFNSGGACESCGGTGIERIVNEKALVPDVTKTLEEGAVAPWNQLMWSLMVDVAREMGVRTDIPYQDLTDQEKEMVLHGPMEKRHILFVPKNGGNATELDFTYYSAENSVKNALAKAKDEKGLARVAKFLIEVPCQACSGTRLSKAARAPKLSGVSLDEVTAMTLEDSIVWVEDVMNSVSESMRPMAYRITEAYLAAARRLLELGLGYLSLDRSGATLSTGERQRVQLARAVRNRTTGVLYVLDEPSIGLHPSNIEGLLDVMHDLLDHGNSVVLVDHDPRLMKACDWLIEMGPQAGLNGGEVIAQGTLAEVCRNTRSLLAPFMQAQGPLVMREVTREDVFARGAIHLETRPIHTVHDLAVDIPMGKLTVVTGVSGSGKTTFVLESLVPALVALQDRERIPDHVQVIEAADVSKVTLVDATPIGANVRSTVATYTGIMDELRRLFAKTPQAQHDGLSLKDFSYNTGSLRCPECDGTGEIDLDVQFLPDVTIPCDTCDGLRFSKDAARYCLETASGVSITLPQLMALTVDEAAEILGAYKGIGHKLQTLIDLGLGYLTLGEATVTLSGGEAQRLKLAAELGKKQTGAVFVFDEPTIGLHPLDVQTLMAVFERLIEKGATLLVIEHDLDFIENADYVIDMGPGGGLAGGRIVATGTPAQIAQSPESITGKYLYK